MLYSVAVTRMRRGKTDYDLLLIGATGGVDATLLMRSWRSQGHPPGGSAWRSKADGNMAKYAEVVKANEDKGYKRIHETVRDMALSELLKPGSETRHAFELMAPDDRRKGLLFLEQMEALTPSATDETTLHAKFVMEMKALPDGKVQPIVAESRRTSRSSIDIDMDALPPSLREHMEREQRQAEQTMITAMPEFGSWA